MIKNILITIIAAILFIPSFSQIPNPSFENTGRQKIFFPAYWKAYGGGRIEKSLDSYQDSFALKVKGSATLVLEAGPFTSGFPYEGKPDHFSFAYKSNMQLGDTVNIFFNLTSSGNLYASGIFTVVGNTSNVYTVFDSLINIIDSSNVTDTVSLYISTNFATDSTYLLLDNVEFRKNNSVEGTLVNGDMELWDTKDEFFIAGWVSTNFIGGMIGMEIKAVVDTPDAYEGNKAIYMKNFPMFGQVIPGFIVTSNPENMMAGTERPGFPVKNRYTYLNGYYKYFPKGVDTFNADIYMYYQGVEIGKGHFASSAKVSTYTPFSCYIQYDSLTSQIPDSATIMIASGSFDFSQAGSAAFVDALRFSNVGIQEEYKNLDIHLYPNPASDYLYISSAENLISKNLNIYDNTGRKITNYNLESIKNGTINVNISKLNTGIYYIYLPIEEGGKYYKFIKL